MKQDRIMSTAGVNPKVSMRVRSYCKLIQSSLIDKWLFADEFVNSHVCMIGRNYLPRVKDEALNKAQVVIIINHSGQPLLSNYDYQIEEPITAAKIRLTLNQISRDVAFKPLYTKEEAPSEASNRFISAFKSIRSRFFNKKKQPNLQLINQERKKQYISRITQKINLNELTPFKIVLLGSPGSGKTTAIKAISDGKALDSDVSATDSVASNKAKTTVGIDYAELKIDETHKRKIKLFGTPGQIKFNYVWDMVGKNADAFIILLDMSRPDPMSYLKFYLKFLKNELGKRKNIYCALTHTDSYSGDITNISDIIESEFSLLAGIYKVDPRDKEHMQIILEDIYLQLEQDDQTNNESLGKLIELRNK